MNTPDHDKENPGECQCCGFVTEALTAFRPPDNRGQPSAENHWYCELCAGTMASTFDRCPGPQPSGQEILKAISYVGNVILARIAASQDPKQGRP